MNFNDFEEKLDQIKIDQKTIIENFIFKELSKLIGQYNFLLETSNSKKNMPLESTLLFLDNMCDLFDEQGKIIWSNFNKFKKINAKKSMEYKKERKYMNKE